MEKQLNKQIQAYLVEFKNDIRQKVAEYSFEETKKINDLLEFIYEYKRLQLEKEDVVKRKRVKNAIPNANRCIGKLANGNQCTRRKRKDCDFCGTHVKGIPNGCIQVDACGECKLKSVEVYAKEFNGIVYYIDSSNRIYKTEDVLSEKQNPLIIGNVIQRNGMDVIEFI